MALATRAEELVRQELEAGHPDWTVELDGARWWVIRDRRDPQPPLARHRDIRVAAEVAEGTRVL